MNKVIAVDVDLTVVDTYRPWMNWFENLTGGVGIKNENGQYDVVPEMKQIMNDQKIYGIDPFEFWKKPDLYDNLEPAEGCIQSLDTFSKWADIIFVSYCVPEHQESKKKFLKKHFPFMSGFIDTHDKHFINYDLLIDDKLAHLRLGEKHRPNAHHLMYTGIRRDGPPGEKSGFPEADDWMRVFRFVAGCL